MSVQREEHQGRQDDVELAERRRAAAAQRIDVERERQTHAVREQLAREADGVEHDLQRESERHADEHLLGDHDETRGGKWRDAAGRRKRRDQRRQRDREQDARARRHEARAEHRRNHEAGADAREREERLRDPRLELPCG